MKLDPNKDYYEQPFGWAAHPDGGNGDKDCQFLIDNRYQLEILGGVEDKDASYSYDDWALVQLYGKYYMLSTSGCSCPSPRETWRIEKGPATLSQIKRHVLDGEYAGYTMPGKQREDFIALLDKAGKAKKK